MLTLRKASHLRIDMWWLDAGLGDVRFLYGWVIARPRSDGTRAQIQDRTSASVAIWSLTIEGSCETLLSILDHFLEGRSAEEALGGILHDQRLNQLKLPMSELALGPTSYQPTLQHSFEFNEFERPTPSPVESVLAQCTAFSRVSKSALFAGIGEIALDVLTALSSLVGLKFLAEHSSRVGNLEFISFPSAADGEEGGLSISFQGAFVVVEVTNSLREQEVFVRCSERSRGRIMSDMLASARTSDAGTALIRFPMADDGPWTTHVDVWCGDKSGHPSGLWAAQVAIPLRGFGISSHISGGRTASANWLRAWAATREEVMAGALTALQKREAHLRKTDAPKWNLADQSARNLRSILSPPQSLDRYHDPTALNSGSFGYLISSLMPLDVVDVIILDPTFDGAGIATLTNEGGKAPVFHVVTAALAHDTERVSALQRAAAFDAADNMPTVEIGLLAVASEKWMPVEHCLIMLDEDGRPLRGFQMSRSLNQAYAERPIVLTEIDRAVLGRVVDIAKALCACDPTLVGDASFRTIWPQSNQVAAVIRDEKPTDDTVAKAMASLQQFSSNFGARWLHASHLLARTNRAGELLAVVADRLDDRFVELLLDESRIQELGEPQRPLLAQHYFLLDVLRGASHAQYTQAWDLVSRWHDRSAWWAVFFASKRLIQTNPTSLIKVLDATIARLVSAPRGDELNATRLHLSSVVLGVVIDTLRGTGESQRRVADALLLGETAFTRALAGSRIGRGVLESGQKSQLATLDLLPTNEQGYALAECAYHLRVNANRSERSETKRDRDLRLAIFEQLLTNWYGFREWQHIARRLDGPLFGMWCTSTHSEFLDRAVDRGLVSRSDVLSFWGDELCARWRTTLTGAHFFYGSADGPLTRLVAGLIADFWPDDSISRAALDVLTDALNILEQPFARSTDFRRWNQARVVALWVRAFAQLVCMDVPPEGVLRELLEPRVEFPADGDPDPLNLASFVREVDSDATASSHVPLAQIVSLLSSDLPAMRTEGYELAAVHLDTNQPLPKTLRRKLVELVRVSSFSRIERGRALQLLRAHRAVDASVRRDIVAEWGYDTDSSLAAFRDEPGPAYELLKDGPEGVDDFLDLLEVKGTPPLEVAIRDAIVAMRYHLLHGASRVGSKRARQWQRYATEHATAVPDSVIDEINRQVGT
jgi:hypothetical protein